MTSRYRIEFMQPDGSWGAPANVPDRLAAFVAIDTVRTTNRAIHAARLWHECRPGEWRAVYEERW